MEATHADFDRATKLPTTRRMTPPRVTGSSMREKRRVVRQ